MSKRIALLDYIEVDGHDLSEFGRTVAFTSDHAQENVSGFNATGTEEYLAGTTVQSVTVGFWMSRGSGEVHDVLYPIHRDKTIVTFKWRTDQTQPVGPTNPQLEGNVQLFTYGEGAERGTAEQADFTFAAVDAAGLTFSES